MDFKAYSSQNAKNEKGQKGEKSKGAGMSQNDVMDAIARYSKFSTEDLMAELGRQITGKDQSEIQGTVDKIKPLLNAEQQKRMEEILKNVRK